MNSSRTKLCVHMCTHTRAHAHTRTRVHKLCMHTHAHMCAQALCTHVHTQGMSTAL